MSKRKIAARAAHGKNRPASGRPVAASARTLPLPGTRRLDQAEQLALPLGCVDAPSGALGRGTRHPEVPRPGRTPDRGLAPPSRGPRDSVSIRAIVADDVGPEVSILGRLNVLAWLGPGGEDSPASDYWSRRVPRLVTLGARDLVRQLDEVAKSDHQTSRTAPSSARGTPHIVAPMPAFAGVNGRTVDAVHSPASSGQGGGLTGAGFSGPSLAPAGAPKKGKERRGATSTRPSAESTENERPVRRKGSTR